MVYTSLLSEVKLVQFDPIALKHAECRLYGGSCTSGGAHYSNADATNKGQGGVLEEIAEARKRISETLKGSPAVGVSSSQSDASLVQRVQHLEKENKEMKNEITSLHKVVNDLQQQMKNLHIGHGTAAKTTPAPPATATTKKPSADDEDDDIDLFGSDEEEDDAEKERIKQERLKAYESKKQAKPGPIAKSSVILDVKPWDDETDMKEMEKQVRTIEMDGLVWGASKLVPLAYGIKKLQIMCVVEDEKVSIEDLQERITEFEDLVQSVDIAAFNKI